MRGNERWVRSHRRPIRLQSPAHCSTTEEVPDKRLAKRKSDFEDQINSAGEYADEKYFILILTSLIFVVLIPLGLWPRIEEYRYRPR